MTASRENILDLIEQNRDTIRGFGVRKLGLFGSWARGEQTAESDLDFIVEFKNKSFDAYMDLKFYLEELFGCPVDLVLTDAIKPRLREAVLNEVVYAEGL